MAREEFSVVSYDTLSRQWANDNRWVFERLVWCEDQGISLAGLEEQTYILSEDGEDYRPIRGMRKRTFEFRFLRPQDAIHFKLFWG
jgi:hypothetical protein